MAKPLVEIPLHHSALDQATNIDAALIASFMLWPDDEDNRKKAIETAIIQIFEPVCKHLTADDVKALIGLAKDADPLHRIQNEAREPFRRGVIVGQVLRECVGRLSTGRTVKLSTVFDEFAAEHMTKKVFDNAVWPKYRPVAHLWAAWVDSALENDMIVFPFELGRIKDFLETAESYRLAAENCRTKQSPKPLIAAEEAFRLPKELGIKPRQLALETV